MVCAPSSSSCRKGIAAVTPEHMERCFNAQTENMSSSPLWPLIGRKWKFQQRKCPWWRGRHLEDWAFRQGPDCPIPSSCSPALSSAASVSSTKALPRPKPRAFLSPFLKPPLCAYIQPCSGVSLLNRDDTSSSGTQTQTSSKQTTLCSFWKCSCRSLKPRTHPEHIPDPSYPSVPGLAALRQSD